MIAIFAANPPMIVVGLHFEILRLPRIATLVTGEPLTRLIRNAYIRCHKVGKRLPRFPENVNHRLLYCYILPPARWPGRGQALRVDYLTLLWASTHPKGRMARNPIRDENQSLAPLLVWRVNFQP
jgi:hypothetical protein